jgi:hypothetical protein
MGAAGPVRLKQQIGVGIGGGVVSLGDLGTQNFAPGYFRNSYYGYTNSKLGIDGTEAGTQLGELLTLLAPGGGGVGAACRLAEAERFGFLLGRPSVKLAVESADDFVGLASASRRSHILDGHRYGGEAGNTWFPKGWSDNKIMHSISDIATDPSLTWVQQTGRAGAAFTRGGAPVRYTVEGVRDGTKIRVVLEPGGEGIITGFPIP